MTYLYILRHGKSSWADPDTDDFDRPLTKRGRNAAARMGREMALRGYAPNLILCSSARRARQTLDHLQPELPEATTGTREVKVDDSFYLAGCETLIRQLGALPEDAGPVLLIGHNPGLHDLAEMLAGKGKGKTRAKLASKFPTAALAVIDLGADSWRRIGGGKGRLDAVIFPRELD
jgi:phosphohistidine phosphatase